MSTDAPGRPRSDEAHESILSATVELLAEKGPSDLTMQGIASRAGVGKSTIYRRWDSKEEVVMAAFEAFVESIPTPDTGSIRGDLRALLGETARRYKTPVGQAILGLIPELSRNEHLAELLRNDVLPDRRATVQAVLERARSRGELRSDVDIELIIDLLYGPLIYRLQVTDDAVDGSFIDALIDAALNGCGPR